MTNKKTIDIFIIKQTRRGERSGPNASRQGIAIPELGFGGARAREKRASNCA